MGEAERELKQVGRAEIGDQNESEESECVLVQSEEELRPHQATV